MVKRPAKILITAVLILFVMGFGAAEAGTVHTVSGGDTVWLLSQRYNTTISAIVQLNNLNNPALIYPGQRLSIPGGSPAVTHTVVPGDTLWNISLRYNTTVSALVQENSISNPDIIFSGQRLAIPGVSMASRGSSGWSFSSADMDLFARLVHSEAAGEPHAGQVAVAASVLNRIKSSIYPNTLRAVIFQVVGGYYQYSPVLDGRINLPANQTAYRAVRDAMNGLDPSLGATGFYNPRKTSNQWVRNQPVTTVIGNHVFFR